MNIKKLFYILLFAITACSVEPIEVDIPVPVAKENPSVEELREIYYNGSFRGTSYYEYYEIFMWEAENYGVDLDYVRDYPVIIEPRIHTNKLFIAWAKEKDNDQRVHIGINKDLFFEQGRTNRGRLFIMFHELGHDILNLEHKPTSSCEHLTSIMNPCGKYDIDKDILKQLAEDLFRTL